MRPTIVVWMIPVFLVNAVLVLNVLVQSARSGTIDGFDGFIIGYVVIALVLAYVAWGQGMSQKSSFAQRSAATVLVVISLVMLPYLALTLAM